MSKTREPEAHPCLLTLQQAAKLLAISKRTLERPIAGGEFSPPLKIGRASRVTAQDIETYLDLLKRRRIV